MVYRVATNHRPPYILVTNTTTGLNFSGILVELLPLLFSAAGFNVSDDTFHYYQTPVNAGALRGALAKALVVPSPSLCGPIHLID
jgi:hypothetical protein